jgi:hypothetical protein
LPIFKKKKPDPFDIPEAWHVLEGQYDGRRMLVRLNAALTEAEGHPDYGFQLGVAVPLNDPLDDGWPTPEEDQQLEAIETRLQKELEETRRAVLAAIITTGGMREFVFYTSTRDWIEAWAPRFDQETEGHAIQVMVRPDSEWSVYRSFRGS